MEDEAKDNTERRLSVLEEKVSGMEIRMDQMQGAIMELGQIQSIHTAKFIQVDEKLDKILSLLGEKTAPEEDAIMTPTENSDDDLAFKEEQIIAQTEHKPSRVSSRLDSQDARKHGQQKKQAEREVRKGGEKENRRETFMSYAARTGEDPSLLGQFEFIRHQIPLLRTKMSPIKTLSGKSGVLWNTANG